MFTKIKKYVTVIILVLCDVLINCLVLRLAAPGFGSGGWSNNWIMVIYFSIILMISNGLMFGYISDAIKKK